MKSGSKQSKVKKVMKEFKSGELKSSSGKKVTNPKQAVAIALSEAGLSKKSTGGYMASKSKKEGKAHEEKESKSYEAKEGKAHEEKESYAEGGMKESKAYEAKEGKAHEAKESKSEEMMEHKRGGGAIMASKKSTMGEALRGGGAIMASKKSTMGEALAEGGYADVRGTGVAIRGFRPAKKS